MSAEDMNMKDANSDQNMYFLHSFVIKFQVKTSDCLSRATLQSLDCWSFSLRGVELNDARFEEKTTNIPAIT